MKLNTDMAIYDKNGQLALMAETKKRLNTSSNWAAKMRRNRLAHGLMPRAKFFLLALPDRFYLWKDKDMTPEVISPNYEIDPLPFLASYYDNRSKKQLEALSGESFELIISSWLSKLLQANVLPSELQDQEWLVESGLFEAIKQGHLAIEVPA